MEPRRNIDHRSIIAALQAENAAIMRRLDIQWESERGINNGQGSQTEVQYGMEGESTCSDDAFMAQSSDNDDDDIRLHIVVNPIRRDEVEIPKEDVYKREERRGLLESVFDQKLSEEEKCAVDTERANRCLFMQELFLANFVESNRAELKAQGDSRAAPSNYATCSRGRRGRVWSSRHFSTIRTNSRAGLENSSGDNATNVAQGLQIISESSGDSGQNGTVEISSNGSGQ